MNASIPPYRIFPLGDTALMLDFGNTIDESINKEVIARFRQFQQEPLPAMIEAVPAYSSLAVYYDVGRLVKKVSQGQTVFEWMKDQLEQRLKEPAPVYTSKDRLIRVPVCYDDEYGPDLQSLALAKGITPAEVISIHTGKTYKVYMLGFLPGFAYMGEVDERICMARKPQPQTVAAGSVGIAGKQTGVYPLASPGGWQVIGRTPLKLFDADNEQTTLLQAGDTVQFYSISKNDFYEIQNSPSPFMERGLGGES